MSIQTSGSLDDSYFEIHGLSTWFSFGWFGVGCLVLGRGESIGLFWGFFFPSKSTCIQLCTWFATGNKCAFNWCSPGQDRHTLCMVKTVLSVAVFVCYLYQCTTLYCLLRPHVGTAELQRGRELGPVQPHWLNTSELMHCACLLP